MRLIFFDRLDRRSVSARISLGLDHRLPILGRLL